MTKNPYQNLPASAFWKTGVTQENPYLIKSIYKKKFTIEPEEGIGTAGSCFAQHISRHLKRNGYNVLDVEPPPPGLPEDVHHKYGFSMYSARYGNIYTVRQLFQLALEAAGEWAPKNYIWEKNGKYFDALRPAVEPEGLDTPEEVVDHREHHISRVRILFESMKVFIFTLGLTEAWVHKDSGTVYPVAPGVIAGHYDKNAYELQNARHGTIIRDFNRFQSILRKMRNDRDLKIILTVSPVPLTASASGRHVLVANSYSKSTLISAAGQLSANQENIDYFPSYEIATNPRLHSTSFAENLRSIREETVHNIMGHFSFDHPAMQGGGQKNISSIDLIERQQEGQCEESLIEVFGG